MTLHPIATALRETDAERDRLLAERERIIRQQIADGTPQAEIARRWGIGQARVAQIARSHKQPQPSKNSPNEANGTSQE